MESIAKLYKRLIKVYPDYPVSFKEVVEHYKKHSFSQKMKFHTEMKQMIYMAKVDKIKANATQQ